eukprot:SAG11_NODE_241_length_11781_cov_8.401900_8_plen_196_part_00
MGLRLSIFQITEVMAEIDMNGSGSVDATEFMDKLKQFGREQHVRSDTCRKLFDEIDTDSSGSLDASELPQLVRKMGFQRYLDDPKHSNFIEDMLKEMDQLSTGDVLNEESTQGDGQVSRDEFLAWYLQKGAFYLDKPHYETNALECPSMARRKELFRKMDGDNSGELSYTEVDEALVSILNGNLLHHPVHSPIHT